MPLPTIRRARSEEEVVVADLLARTFDEPISAAGPPPLYRMWLPSTTLRSN